MVKQPVYRSGKKAAQQAQNLIAAIVPGAHVLKVTKAEEAGQGIITIEPGIFYAVESPKFPGRYYAVRKLANGRWWCSDERNERVAARCISQVEAMLIGQQASA